MDSAARAAVLANVVIAEETRYSFRHALVREAIHTDLLPGERGRFHTAYAQALEERVRENADPSECCSSEIAEHWFAAHNHAKAFPAALAAMEQARASYAYGDAAAMGERALDLWQNLPDAERVSGMSHVDLLAKTASALRNAGDGERSLAMVTEAIDECDDRTGVRFARLLRDKAYYLANNGLPGSIPLLEQALELVPEGVDEVLRGTLLNTLAARLMVKAELDRAIELADQALSLARSIDSPGQASVAANLAGLSRAQRGDIAAGLAQLDLARELAQGDPSAMLRYRVNASDLMYHLGRFEEALQLAEEGIARARELGVERSSGVILASNAVDPLLALGQWDRGEALIDRTLALAPPPAFRVYLQRAKLWLLLWRGDLDAAARSYRGWRSSITGPNDTLRTTPRRRRCSARPACSPSWRSRKATSTRHGPRHRCSSPTTTRPCRHTICHCSRVAAAILARYRAEVEGRTAGGRSGLGGRCRGIRAGAAGDRTLLADVGRSGPTHVEAELGGDGTGNGVDEWRRALAAAKDGQAHLRPYGLYRLGQALVAAGDRAEARESLREAVAAAEQLGAGLITSRVAAYAEPRRLGARGRDSVTAGGQP